MNDLNRFFRTYFYTEVDANKAIRQLEPYFQCSPPVTVAPANGRPVFVLIEVPEASVPQSQFPQPILFSEILQVVLTYNGIIRENNLFNE